MLRVNRDPPPGQQPCRPKHKGAGINGYQPGSRARPAPDRSEQPRLSQRLRRPAGGDHEKVRRLPGRVKWAGLQLSRIRSLQHTAANALEGPGVATPIEVVGHAKGIDEGRGRRKIEARRGQDTELNQIAAGFAGQHGGLSDAVLGWLSVRFLAHFRQPDSPLRDGATSGGQPLPNDQSPTPHRT